MDTQLMIVLIAAVVVVVVVGVGAWYYVRRTNSTRLREQFGPEYDRTVARLRSEELAEAELKERKKRVSTYKIVSLPQAERAQYQENWLILQSRFVDDPEATVADADRLVEEVMDRKGYPVTRFEQAAADLSVDHADVVENYRAAHRIAEQSRGGRADTEELREALVFYRALFQELLEIDDERDPARKEASETRRNRARV
jgi:hypothetical protein